MAILTMRDDEGRKVTNPIVWGGGGALFVN